MSVEVVEPAHELSLMAALGEGPVWDYASGALWFVDILAPAIHRFEPSSGAHSTWPTPEKVGWVLPDAHGCLIAGLAKGLHRFSPNDGGLSPLVSVEPDLPFNRVNDGASDCYGNIWFGTMDDLELSGTGRFYRFDGTSILTTPLAPATITNGPAVSPDGKTLYLVDTLERQISACSIGPDFQLGPARVLIEFTDNDGYPDGITCDAQGGLWIALWGGWAARRYDATGRLTTEVRFPVANVTKVAIGGLDGLTAYATTARKGLDDEALEHQPLAGDLFSFKVRVGAPRGPQDAP